MVRGSGLYSNLTTRFAKGKRLFFRGVGVEIGRCCQFFWRFSGVYVDSMSIIGAVMSIMPRILLLSAVHWGVVYGVAAAIPCPYNDRQTTKLTTKLTTSVHSTTLPFNIIVIISGYSCSNYRPDRWTRKICADVRC